MFVKFFLKLLNHSFWLPKIGQKENRKKTSPRIYKDFHSRLDEINKLHYSNAFRNFYRFCFVWSTFVTIYFWFQHFAFALGSVKNLSSFLYISAFASVFFAIFLSQHKVIFERLNENRFFILTTISLAFLPLAQWLFIQAGGHRNVGALHTLNGIPYAMFMVLYFFLPSWKLTVVGSLFAFSFYVSHYFIAQGTFWLFIDSDGEMISAIIDWKWILRTTVGFFVFLIFTIAEGKRKEEKNKHIEEIFLQKHIVGTHLKMMDVNIDRIFNSSWKIKTRVEFADDIHGADFVCVVENDDKVYVAVGDVVGHGLEVSSGSFLASSCIRSLALVNTHPMVIFNTLNKLLYRFEEHEGGEAFMELLVLRKDGSVQIYGDASGHTIVNGKQVVGENRILGKTEDQITIDYAEFKLKKKQRICVATDGWSKKDLNDDRTSVWIEFLGENEKQS